MSWFDLRREVREVTQSHTETGQGMALCRMHADRFTVPVGWSLKLLGDKSNKSATPKSAATEKKTSAKKSPAESKKKSDSSKDAPSKKSTKPAVGKASTKAKKSKAEPAKKSTQSQKKRSKPDAKASNAAAAETPREPEVNPHARETAWFMPDSFEEDAELEDAASPLLGSAAEGSLLARAFNGPNANDSDASTGDDESGNELPFPPHGGEVVVSERL